MAAAEQLDAAIKQNAAGQAEAVLRCQLQKYTGARQTDGDEEEGEENWTALSATCHFETDAD